jgi:hypothetical protein
VTHGVVVHRAWVEGAKPEAPRALTARVHEVLEANPAWSSLALPDALVAAGEQLLAGVIAKGAEASRDRATALDLLAADACVTWAFEAASAEPESLLLRARKVTAHILAAGNAG